MLVSATPLPPLLSFSTLCPFPSVSLSLRDNFTTFLNFMGHLSYQCDRLLGDQEMMTFLQKERYDITILDAFNPCSFILARKLGTAAATCHIVFCHYYHQPLHF